MTKEDFKKLLVKLNVCDDAREWAEGKTWEEFYNTCHRGDWLLWLFTRTNSNDLQLLTLAKGHCANMVRHLMKDKRSLEAVDAAIAFGEGKITKKELNAVYNSAVAAYAAADAAAATDAAAAAVATYASNAAYAYNSAVDAYVAAVAVVAAYAANTSVKKENQKLTADIVRKYIAIEKFKV